MKNISKPKGIRWGTGLWKVSFSVILLLFSNVVKAQWELSTDIWHEGYIVLENNDTLRGQIKYNLETGVIQFSNQLRNDAFTGKNALYFQFYDRLQERIRRFFSLPYNLKGDYESMVFFEVLVEGQLNLLVHEKREMVTKSSYYWGIYYTYGQEILRQYFYLLEYEGKIEAFDGKKSVFVSYISKHQNEVNKFIKTNRLNTNKWQELVRIVNYYNQFFK